MYRIVTMGNQSKTGWESPHTSDWNSSSINGRNNQHKDDEILVSDESDYGGESLGKFGEEYFTSLVDHEANEGLFDPSSNVDSTPLANEIESPVPAAADVFETKVEEILFDVHQLTLGIDQTVTSVDILTPKSKCSDTYMYKDKECAHGNVCGYTKCTNVIEPVASTANVEEVVNEGHIVGSESEGTTSEADSASGDKGAKVTGDSEKSRLNNNIANKLLWIPKSSTPIYMSRSEESKRKIELARKKASKGTIPNEFKNKVSALAKDGVADIESIRMKIANNAKVTAESKAAIVSKERQRVVEASKARKEARDRYIKEARKHVDSIKTASSMAKILK